MFNDNGENMALGAFNYANMAHGQNGGRLQGMANDVMQAMANENDSRVAQAREMRRMQHEKEMEQMRLNALIGRLDQTRPGFWK